MLIIECNGNTQSGDTIYLESHNICIKGQESYYFYDNTGLFGTLTIADSIEKAKDYLFFKTKYKSKYYNLIESQIWLFLFKINLKYKFKR